MGERKTAVVTGAGDGIGRAIAVRLGKDGFHVYVTDMDIGRAQETAGIITAAGGAACACEMNVLNADQIRAVVDQVISEHDRIDVWCNNAGVSSMRNCWEMTEKDWDFNMDINAKGVFLCTIAFLPQMMKQRKGKIINTASIASLRSDPLLSCYCASKWAVAGYSRTIAKEMGPYGITCNYVCPGIVSTSMNSRETKWSADIQGKTVEQVHQDMLDLIPLGKFTTPEDVAGVVSFLAGPDSDGINGAQMTVTGGMEA